MKSNESGSADREVEVSARVEAVLLDLPPVADAVVLARNGRDGGRRMIAYVQPGARCGSAQLREELAVRSQFDGVAPLDVVLVSSIPRDSHGQIDVAALEALPVLDEELAAWCERETVSRPGVTEAAAVIRARPATATPRIRPRVSPVDMSSTRVAGPVTNEIAATPSDAPLAICEGEQLALDPDAPTTLAEMLAQCCERFGERQIVHVETNGSSTVHSYHELEVSARRVLAGLRAIGVVAGQFVLLQLDRTADFLAGFWGCVLGGCVPVPISIASSYQPDNAAVRKLRHAWETLGRPLVLASDGLVPLLQERCGMAGVRVANIRELRRLEPLGVTDHATADDLALLLFTSASTGASKAVTHTHRTLIARSLATCRFNGHSSDDVSVNWMPLDHVGGIVMFHLRDVACGAAQVHASTNWVLEEPLRWLDLIDRYRATTTWAPNFAYALVNERMAQVSHQNWDLSPMRFVLNGGEMIVPATARRFLRLLAPHGLRGDAMRPAWGMSETASGVTFDHEFVAAEEAGRAGVPVGRPIPGFAMRIVDSNDRALRQGQVGRLQVRGEMVTPGYYHDDRLNAEAFSADRWFNTGDLAFIDRSGRLTITGREKDEIIINGANVSAAEIEMEVAAVEGVDASAVAATSVRRPGQNTDDVAVFFKPTASPDNDEAIGATVQEVRVRIASHCGFAPTSVVPLPEQEFPRTEIGKIQRRVLRERLEEGRYDSVIERVRRLTADDDVPNWFFTPTWRPRAARRRDMAHGDATLAIVDDTSLVQATSQLLRAGRVVEAPDSAAMSASLNMPGEVPKLVLYNFGYGGAPSRMEGLLALIQALALRNRAGKRMRLVVTSSSLPSAATVAARGILTTASRELPWLECRHVALEGKNVADDARLLSGEAVMREVVGEVAYRDGRRFVRLLERADVSHPRRAAIRRGGCYVISGGAGGVGVKLAKHLMMQYGARVLLIGRRYADNADVREALSFLERFGDVRYACADVTDASQVASACDAAGSAWGDCGIDGAFHAAGVIDDRFLVDESAQSLASAMNPKIDGARVLHEVLKRSAARSGAGGPLLVLFSSVAGYFGGSGAGAYAAANAALGGFADEVAAADGGVDVRCLYWSRWSGTGMGARDAMEDAARAAGFHPMSASQAIASLDIALELPHRHVVIGVDDQNPSLRPLFSANPQTLEQLSLFYAAAEETADVASPVVDPFGVVVPRQITRVPRLPRDAAGGIDRDALISDVDPASPAAGEPGDALQRQVLATFREVLEVSRMGINDSFLLFGGNSLLATQIVSRLRAAVAPGITLRDLFECPTTFKLCERLRATAGVALAPEDAITATAAVMDPLPNVDGLSDDQVNELLEQVMRQEAAQ